MEVKFGTDGWRGIIGRDFTVANVRLAAQALADYMNSQENKPVCIIGYDTRFMSDYFARETAQVLAGNGIKVLLTEKPVTSPVLSFTVRNLSAAGGVMVTASHNPPIYNGIKFKGPYGGSALPEVVSQIEKNIGKGEVKTAPANSHLIELFNPDSAYLKHLSTLVNVEKIVSSGIRFVVDPMYGSSQGYFRQLFSETQLTEIHSQVNPGFGGTNPEPIGHNLSELAQLVENSEARVGLALDGDGDRIGIICSDGSFMNSHQIFALLLQYLVEHRQQRGEVVKTFSTSQMLDKLASKYTLTLHETPIGFKYICDLFLTRDILIGGEESGGIGFKNHLPERDGILSGLLFLSLMAETGLSPEQLLKDLYSEIGQFCYDRKDVHVEPSAKEMFQNIVSSNPPTTFADLPVAEIKTLDGIKFCFANDAWVLFRFSGTEPVLRLYAEAADYKTVGALLTEAKRLANKLR